MRYKFAIDTVLEASFVGSEFPIHSFLGPATCISKYVQNRDQVCKGMFLDEYSVITISSIIINGAMILVNVFVDIYEQVKVGMAYTANNVPTTLTL